MGQRRRSGARRVALLSAAALAVGAGLVLPATPAHADGGPGPGWAGTATGAVHLANAAPLGAAPAAAPVPVIVGLAERDPQGLTALLAAQQDPASPSYHRYLTPAEFAARFGATAAQAQHVAGYLTSQGLTDVHVSPSRLSVSAQATAQTATRAFNTTLARFHAQGRDVIVNTAPAQVPASLAGVVTAVVGLDQAAHATHNVAEVGGGRPPAAAPAVASDHSPSQLAQIYDASSLPPATGTSLAIMANGNLGQVVQDLHTAEAQYGLPTINPIIEDNGGGPDTSGVDEYDLDTQASTGMAGNVAKLYIYDPATLDTSDVASSISQWVTDDLAQVGSASYGFCDSDAQGGGASSLAQTLDPYLQEAQAQGQAFFASTGDTGSSCTNFNNQSSVQTSYPASSTWATGVGGTTLAAAGTTYGSESAWSSSGGGKSTEARPSYANDADNADLTDLLATGSARGVPDIAMDANPSSGADIVFDGSVGIFGGTSLSSPLAAGAWARLQSSNRNGLGPAAPDLYGLYNKANGTGLAGATPGLHDVTTGSNGTYQAHTGYDLTTGLGTMDVAALNTALRTPPTFTADTPPATGTVASFYSYTFAATALPSPTYSVSSGTLPYGLGLNPSTGQLAGTPTKAGTYTFQVTASNGVSPDATTGTLTITVAEPASGSDAVFQGSTGNETLSAPIVGMAVDPATGGYWLVASDGGVFAFNAPFYGSEGNVHLNKPIVGMAAVPDGSGYYLVAADGGIFTFGPGAHFQGSAGNLPLVKPVVGMTVDPTTGGYWLVASDGGIFNYGAPFDGSAGNIPLVKPIVGMASTPDGGGYYLVASDGGIFTYGDAVFQGSEGNKPLAKPVVGMAVDQATGGYWLVASDGGIFTFNTPFNGSAGNIPLVKPIVGMAPTPTGRGYYMVASDGGIFTY
jgi:pseudomonalisin